MKLFTKQHTAKILAEHNLRSTNGVLVYTGAVTGDIGDAVSKHREKRVRLAGKIK